MFAELFEAIKKGDRATVDRLVSADPGLAEARDPDGVSAVLTALYYGRREIAVLLLARKPSLDIFEASAVGDVQRVRRLLDQDPSLANAVAPDGFRPLGLAAFFKRPEIVALLLERGADAAPPSGNPQAFTALHSAVADDAGPRDISIIRGLLDAGAPVNARSGTGTTPLHTAAFTGDAEVAELLLERGADPRIASDAGKTAIDTARERGHTELAARLERA
jgi:adenosylhomocysteine nucleosidase